VCPDEPKVALSAYFGLVVMVCNKQACSIMDPYHCVYDLVFAVILVLIVRKKYADV